MAIPGVILVRPMRFTDRRGYFCETYNWRDFAEIGIGVEFVQDNCSYSAQPLTFRGFHFQSPPHAQSKLIRVVTGRVLDIVVDLRVGSPDFCKHLATELSAESGEQLFVPEGFAHGILTLEPETVVSYKVSNYYEPRAERGIIWSDPELGISWAARPTDVSEKDSQLPMMRDLVSPFVFSERHSAR